MPRYLEFSMDHLTRDQKKLRDQMEKTFGPKTFHALEDQVRANMAFFSEAMRMWTPFTPSGLQKDEPVPGKAPEADELDTLKKQMLEMQEKLEGLTRKKEET